MPNEFDAGTLGLAQNYLSAITYNKFPVIEHRRLRPIRVPSLGDRSPTDLTWYSHSVNVSLSRLWGRHTLKFGGDYRQIGAQSFSRGQPAGSFYTKNFTRGPNPNIAGRRRATRSRAICSAYPNSGSITVGTPADFYVNYVAGYAQDDFRVTSAADA